MNPLAIALALLAAFAGTACFYLASPQQRWRAAALPARPAVGAGLALGAVSLAAFGSTMHLTTAVFTFAVWTMLLLVLFPYVGAVLFVARGGR